MYWGVWQGSNATNKTGEEKDRNRKIIWEEGFWSEMSKLEIAEILIVGYQRFCRTWNIDYWVTY